MQIVTIAASFAVALLTCLIFALLWRRRLRDDLETEAIISGLRGEVSELITDLNGTTERNIALLESRIRQINDTVERAAKLQKVLETESEKQQTVDRIYSELGRNRPMNLSVEDPGDNEAPQQELDQVDFETLSLRDKALVLHRRGDSPDVIGEQLNMSRGEVELIISLHERRPHG